MTRVTFRQLVQGELNRMHICDLFTYIRSDEHQNFVAHLFPERTTHSLWKHPYRCMARGRVRMLLSEPVSRPDTFEQLSRTHRMALVSPYYLVECVTGSHKAAHSGANYYHKYRQPVVDWRLILTHSDYDNADKNDRRLRIKLARAARGEDLKFADGSKIFFVKRGLAWRYADERRITWEGAGAREMMLNCNMPARCAHCGKKPQRCTCEWVYDGSGLAKWREPEPELVSGVSALEFKNEPIVMRGKQGLAVGVEWEVYSIGKPHLAELNQFCIDHGITRKYDGSNGVTLEFATSPMREDVSRDILANLWHRVNATKAEATVGCGLHIHVDGTGLGREELARLINLWQDYGPRVWSAMPEVRQSSPYCGDTTVRGKPNDVEYWGGHLEIDGWDNYYDRYVDMNLENMRSGRKTVEFRLFPAYSGSEGYEADDHEVALELVDKDLMLAYVELARAFVRAAITNDTAPLQRAIQYI